MSELSGVTPDAPHFFPDGIRVHLGAVNGNGVNGTVKSGASPSPCSSSEDIPDEVVRKELGCILDSQAFKDKAMLRGFLCFVVEETLAGRAHQIKGYTVATQVFGRRNDFDPTIDPIVRIQAGRLRRALESYYLGQGKRDQLRIDIGKGSYIPTFSMTIPEKPKVVRLQRPAGTSPSEINISQNSAEILPFSTGTGASIAVMPLVNLTSDPDQCHMADGLIEELMIELARCPSLQVNALHSSAQWKGKQIGAEEIGRRLGVRFFLEGSLREECRNIKFNVRLIDTSTGMQIWGEQYRRHLESDNMIDLQEEIARSIAGRIGGVFGIVPRKLALESRMKAPGDLDLLEAFLRFSQYQSELSPQGHAEALEALEHVCSRNPESGIALSMLSCLYADQYAFFSPDMEELIEKAVEFARRGAFLEPQSQLVRSLVVHALFVAGEKEHFFREAEQLLLLRPNSPDCMASLGWEMALYGEWERGLLLLERGLELNPFYPGWFRLAPYLNYCRQGQFEAAYREAQNFNTPKLFWDPLVRAAALGQLGRKRKAIAEIKKIIEFKPDFSDSGPELIRLWVKDPEVHQILIDGLRKAGL